MAQRTRIRLVALGNGVWLDEIRREGHAPIKDIPGGSVTFATLGSRLFLPNEPTAISMTFNAGGDFPNSVIELFRNWSIDLTVHHLSDQPSSRGLVFYEKANDNRKGFQRLTEPMPVLIKDLQGTPLLSSQAFHFFGTALYMEDQIADLTKLREVRTERSGTPPPFIVWEPHAKSCLPTTLPEHQHAARLVDVFSPNHEELASFFGAVTDRFDESEIERQARTFLDAGIGIDDAGCMLVRAAGHGCMVMCRDHKPQWLPSYYPADSHMVVDATGAGNAFLGAFAVGWQETHSYVEAALYGQIAASFVIEQVGLPARFGYGEREAWNNCMVRDRLAKYKDKIGR